MPHNPLDTKQHRRLRRSMTFSRRQLEGFRRRRLNAIEQYVGGNYSDNGSPVRVPAPFLELAVNIYGRQLAAKAPQVLINTTKQAIKPAATIFALAVNHLLEEINFEESVRCWALDALFTMGIMKVGLVPKERGEIEGFLHDSGQPFADVVDLDDWVHDMNARRFESIHYAGNRYYMPHEYIMESKEFQTGKGPELRPTGVQAFDEQGNTRVEAISRGETRDFPEDFKELSELWDIWLPEEQLVVTYAADETGIPAERPPLRVVDWSGPEIGPYHILSYGKVPNNIMPLSPVSLLMELHMLGNNLFRKLERQAERQKRIGVVSGGADEDGKRIINADDGELIRVDRPESTREASLGGIDQTNLAFFLQSKELFNFFGGNFESIAGLGPQSETFSQDRLLAQTASQRLRDMQDSTMKSVKEVVESLADYVWYDPTARKQLVLPIEGTDLTFDVEFRSDMKEGDRLDYHVEITPFSMQSRSPDERLQTITQAVERFYLPLAPLLIQQGVMIDFPKLFEIIAQYSNTPEINEIIRRIQPPAPEGGEPGSERSTQSPVTTRENVRRSVPQATPRGQEQVLSQLLLGNGQQRPQTTGTR